MELYIEKNFGERTQNIWLYQPGMEYDTFYGYHCECCSCRSCKGSNGNLVEYRVEKHLKPSPEMKPFLTLPSHFATDFIRLLTAEASKMGINTEKESKLEGRLEATQLHLQDLQRITIKLLDIEP